MDKSLQDTGKQEANAYYHRACLLLAMVRKWACVCLILSLFTRHIIYGSLGHIVRPRNDCFIFFTYTRGLDLNKVFDAIGSEGDFFPLWDAHLIPLLLVTNPTTQLLIVSIFVLVQNQWILKILSERSS